MVRYTNRYAVLITAILLVAAFLTGCRDGIFAYKAFFSDNSPEGDSLMVIPVRREYLINGVFNKQTDFSVFVVYPDGLTAEIDPAGTDVSIGDTTSQEPLEGDEYEFTVTGERMISVAYKKQSALYAVWVLSGEEGSGGGDGDTSIIVDIQW